MKDKKQRTLFEQKEWWEDDWEGMPEYKQERFVSIRTIKVCFKTKEDIKSFEKLIKQKIYPTYDTYWYPKQNIKTVSNKTFIDDES